MNKTHSLLISFIITLILSSSCTSSCTSKYLEIDPLLLQTKIFDPSITNNQSLSQTTVLYLDHSTCVIDAVKNSEVFKVLRPNLGQYCDTLKLIKGNIFESIQLDRKDNKVSEALEKINSDISFADIRSAVFNICNDNQQAILISDCESYANGRFLDLEPYMSEPFKLWISKGRSIYIITEPYQEKYKGINYDKKRFYIIFTDNKLKAPISNIVSSEIKELVEKGVCTWFQMTNSDILVESPKDTMVNNNLTFTVEYLNGFNFISVDDSWESIQEYVMKLDKYGEPISAEKPEPLIRNLKFNDGNNYKVSDITIEATNITSRYLAIEDSTILVNDIDISKGFVLDKESLESKIINLFLTDKIFTEGFLLGKEYGGNLIRLDFIINTVDLKTINPDDFEWQSIWSPNKAICVSKSIDNALRDMDVVPTTPKRRIIHTVFLKTECY